MMDLFLTSFGNSGSIIVVSSNEWSSNGTSAYMCAFIQCEKYDTVLLLIQNFLKVTVAKFCRW